MDELERRVARSIKAHDMQAPEFDTLFSTAKDRAANRRSRRHAAFALAAAASFAVLIVTWPQSDAPSLISDEELLGSTSWSAPSDVLLPVRQTNIFDDLPALPESTGPVGETLL